MPRKSREYYRANYDHWRTAWFLEEFGGLIESIPNYWGIFWRVALVVLIVLAFIARLRGWVVVA
jgi:hypothetical protein